ncbi:unnamed protein product [Ceratitis capitata]|uniref:(Mediterranean fruit fly) hypothetical protein n=1 Tax=Ceratitis capitata TaxID=7213 RepID=A0A811UZY1_CERCA|nr:unnamed protein product [Ceratitis capitata]
MWGCCLVSSSCGFRFLGLICIHTCVMHVVVYFGFSAALPRSPSTMNIIIIGIKVFYFGCAVEGIVKSDVQIYCTLSLYPVLIRLPTLKHYPGSITEMILLVSLLVEDRMPNTSLLMAKKAGKCSLFGNISPGS